MIALYQDLTVAVLIDEESYPLETFTDYEQARAFACHCAAALNLVFGDFYIERLHS